MDNRFLKIFIVVLILILVTLSYILFEMLYPDTSYDEPKEKGTFKATTPEGKLREISGQLRDR